MDELDLDAIIAPTNGPAWVTDPVNGDLGGDFSTFVGSFEPGCDCRYANVTVPAGYAGPLPIGVFFMGGEWDVPTLISLRCSFEQATQVRVRPQFIQSTSVAAASAGAAGREREGGSKRPDRRGEVMPLRDPELRRRRPRRRRPQLTFGVRRSVRARPRWPG